MEDSHADIVIHVDEALDGTKIQGLEHDLGCIDGVYSVCVHERTPHLMVVEYDPFSTNSGQLLTQVETRGLHAELIGL